MINTCIAVTAVTSILEMILSLLKDIFLSTLLLLFVRAREQPCQIYSSAATKLAVCSDAVSIIPTTTSFAESTSTSAALWKGELP
jgi:hypothetical protein